MTIMCPSHFGSVSKVFDVGLTPRGALHSRLTDYVASLQGQLAAIPQERRTKLDELAATRVLGRIVLEEVTTSGVNEAAGRRKEQQITGILAPSDQTASLQALSYDELLERTGVGKEDTPPAIAEVHAQSVRSEVSLQREIVSKRHLRLAMSATCLVMVLLGAAMAMKLREALPLTVYLWAFFPALVAVLTISTAEQFAHQSGWPGLVVMWGSVIGLLVYAGTIYKRVSLR